MIPLFDIIGDIHGCYNELVSLLAKLGYNSDGSHPANRTIVFLGDITDRGPNSVECMILTLDLVESGHARYVPGNHCNKLSRYLKGNKVKTTHGLETTIAELERLSPKDRDNLGRRFVALVENAQPYLQLDQGNLIVAHAGIKESLIGKQGRSVQSFCLYGDVDGSTHPDGRPIRKDWAQHYHGNALIVYGHTPVPSPRWVNNTVNIDQGCVFGGHLSALRYPGKEVESVCSTIDDRDIADNPLHPASLSETSEQS